MTDLPADSPCADGDRKVSERTGTARYPTATHLLETRDLQDRVETVFGEANRRLRWALGVSLVSSAVLVLQDYGTLFWLTSSSGYVLNACLSVTVAVAFWVWWDRAAGEARTFDRELERLMLGTKPE